MKVLNRSQLLAIVLTLTLFGTFLITQLLQNPVLYSLDPWTQKFFSSYGESHVLFSHTIPIHSGTLVLPYNSFLRTTTYLVSTASALDNFLIFQVGSIVLRIIYAILVMMIVVTITHRVQYALVTALLVFTSSFFIFRSHSLIPQNVAVLFFLLMIWGFEKYNKTGRIVFLLPVMLSLLANALYHPASIIISGIIILSYTVNFLINEKLRHVEFTYFGVLICVVLLLPIFDTLILVVQNTAATFGDNSVWAQYAKGEEAQLRPVINTYFEMIGYPVMTFSILGIVTIIWRDFRRYVHLIIMLVLILLLSLNLSPQLSLSPDKMQDFTYIPLLLISAVYVSVLFSRTGRIVRMMLIAILITMGIATMIKTPPRFDLQAGELQIAGTINTILEENPDAIVYIEAEAMFTVTLIHYPEQVCTYWDPIFKWYRPPASGDVPDCTQTRYRLRKGNQTLPQYRTVRQVEGFHLYERLPET